MSGELWGPQNSLWGLKKIAEKLCRDLWSPSIWNAKVGVLPRMPKTFCIIGHVSSEVCHAVVRSENCLTYISTKAEFVDVSQELPLHFLHRQIQTGIPKVKLEDQTLGPTQNIEDDTCKPHWLLSCDSVNQCWTRAWQILECYRKRQKGEFTGTSFAVKKVNLKLISSLTWSNTVLNDDPRCEKTCLKFRWLCKIKRWNLRQRQRERHLDCYSWALQVCQAPVEGQRWDNEGRAWSYSSESAAFQTYSPLVSQRNFPSEVKLNQSFNNQGSGGDLHMKMCKFTHCTRPFRGGSGSVTGYFSSSRGRIT